MDKERIKRAMYYGILEGSAGNKAMASKPLCDVFEREIIAKRSL